jgi:hexokinase
MAGSKVDIPKDLLEQIRYLEELFTVDTKKLKEISNHFVSELAKGGLSRSLLIFVFTKN